MKVYDLDLDAEGAPRFVVDKADYDALAAEAERCKDGLAWEQRRHTEARTWLAEAQREIERLNDGWAEANSTILARDIQIVGLKGELAEEVASHDKTRAIQTAAQVRVLFLTERLAEAETLLRVARVALNDSVVWNGYLETVDQYFRRCNAHPV